jgi:hypothetical protein
MPEHTFSVPIAADKNGFIDRECPSQDCLFPFKVHRDDWKKIFRDDEVFCPQCRHSAPSNRWHTQAQIKHFEGKARNYMERELHNMLQGFGRDFNSRQDRNSLVTISMKVSGGSYRSYTLPSPAIEPFELTIKCDDCGARFAVIGSAFFCPCCGRNSAEKMFDSSLEKIEAKLGNLDALRSLLEKVGQKNEAANICRSLIESCLFDLVGALQRLCEELYARTPRCELAPFNAFQRLTQSSEMWRKPIGEGYEEWLGQSDFNSLKIYYQRRHLLTHHEGIVDQQYIYRSGDNTYRLGQRIVVTSRDAVHMRDLISKIATQLRKRCTP